MWSLCLKCFDDDGLHEYTLPAFMTFQSMKPVKISRGTAQEKFITLLQVIALFIAFCYLYIYGWVDKAGLFLSGDFWPLGLFCCVLDKDRGNTISLVQSSLRVLYF